MNKLLESILDDEQEIDNKLDQAHAELKSKIIQWMCENTYVSLNLDYRKTTPEDFEVGDDLLISMSHEKHMRGVSLHLIQDIPNYIRFKYVSQEFKMNSNNVKGDASFLLKSMSNEGWETVSTFYIKDCPNITSVGDLRKMDQLSFFHVENNPKLTIKPNQFPKNIKITLTYEGNKNKLSITDAKKNVKYPFSKIAIDDYCKDFA